MEPPNPPQGPESGSWDPMLGRVVLERYRLDRRIGSGGMGAVYVAEQVAVGREVAVKVLRPHLLTSVELKARFKREAEIIGQLRHPHNIQLFDYGETDDGMAVMVTELLVGESLQDLLARRGRLSVEETVMLGTQVAGALAEAHDLGLVHRDLKPANLFVTWLDQEIHTKVLDFGIARLVDEEQARITATGQVFGTPRYMSPEQTMAAGEVDARSDLYSLGLVLYECLCGDSPYQAATGIQYLAAHHHQEPPPLRGRVDGLPDYLDRLLQSLLQKDPGGRPSDARTVRNALLSGRVPAQAEAATGVLSSAHAAAHAPTETRPGAEGAATPREPGDLEAGGMGRPSRTAILWAVLAMALSFTAVAGMMQLWPKPVKVVTSLQPVPDGMSPDRAPSRTSQSSPTPGEPDLERTPGGEPAPEEDPHSPAPSQEPGVREPSAPDGSDEPSPKGIPRQPKRSKRPPKNRSTAPRTVVTGPRGLVVPEVDAPVDHPQLARQCQTSEWRGLARLSTQGCAPGCAVLVDAMCAGRTPAEERAVAPGVRTVRVFCDGKLVRKLRRRFREQETTVVSCP